MVLGPLHPARLTGSARDAMTRMSDVVATGAALPARIVGMVGQAEALLGQARTALQSVDATIAGAGASLARVDGILNRTEATVGRADALLASTETILGQTRALLRNAGGVTDEATATLGTTRKLTDGASGMLDQLEPTLRQVLPLVERFASSLSAAEVDAAIKLVDELPALTESLQTDILPILRTLDRVGPDINELLHVMDDVRHAIIGIPGFSFFKKRGTERIEEDDAFELHPHDPDARPAVGPGSDGRSADPPTGPPPAPPTR